MPFTLPKQIQDAFIKTAIVDQATLDRRFESNLNTIIHCTYVQPDTKKLLAAVVKMRKLSLAKHVKSMLFMADAHQSGNISFISLDFPSAQRLYLEALNIGIDESQIAGKVYYKLYVLYNYMDQVETAMVFLHEAARLLYSEAMFQLSKLEKHPDLSHKLRMKAAKMHHENAIFFKMY